MNHTIRDIYGHHLLTVRIPNGTPEHMRHAKALGRLRQRRGKLPDLTDANLRDSSFHDFDFSDMELHGVDFRNANCRGAKFYNASLHVADFSHCDLSDAHFDGADLYKATFYDADLQAAELANAKLDDAHLIDLGISIRGNRWVVVPGNPPRINAGCRRFTFREARVHWYGKFKKDPALPERIDTMARLIAAEKLARAMDWI